MILVALTGGIGSGKSVVAQLLSTRGAVAIDADAIVHELQVPGAPLLDRLAERFGTEIIRPDGSLDRAGLAAIAFHDDAALADLNGIVHPAVREEIARRITAEQDTDHVVVVDTPLLTVARHHDFAAVVVVDVPIDVAVQRLVALRKMDEADARARIAKQITRDERLAQADRVIDNSGDLDALDAHVDELWEWLQQLPPAPRAVAVRWLTAFIDRPAATFEATTAFWLQVTGSTLSPTRGDRGEFATLLPADGDAYARVQRVEDGQAGAHLDWHVDDVRVFAVLATSLGASVVAELNDVVVLASPAGLPFCIVAHHGEAQVPTATTLDDGTRVRLCQVCIDVAPEHHDAECAFWAALTRWPHRPGIRPEYSSLEAPVEVPVRILFQRLDEAHAGRNVEAHLDVFSSDAHAAAEQHRARGAEVIADFPFWTLMRDPTGVAYCLIRRDPDADR
ncbi:MAG: dephospho-CoA kinase [Ilumatobacteraceae bacterium]